ncbi:MAG: hypothetical protein ACMUIU_00425 [bacterium]
MNTQEGKKIVTCPYCKDHITKESAQKVPYYPDKYFCSLECFHYFLMISKFYAQFGNLKKVA